MKTTELIFNGVSKLNEKMWKSKGYQIAQNIDFDEYKLTEECTQHLINLQDETLNKVLDTFNELKEKAFKMANELIYIKSELYETEKAIEFIKDNENLKEVVK